MDTVTLYAVLAIVLVGFGAGVWVWWIRHFAPHARKLVLTVFSDGEPATVVRSLDTKLAGRVIVGTMTIAFALFSVAAFPSSVGGAVVLLLLALYLGVGFWLMQSGRWGDGSIRLTPTGIHQRANGFEHGVQWDDLTGIQMGFPDVVLESQTAPVRRRLAPRWWVGTARRPGERTMVLNLGTTHPDLQLPLMNHVHRCVDDRLARAALGTPAAAEQILGDVRQS